MLAIYTIGLIIVSIITFIIAVKLKRVASRQHWDNKEEKLKCFVRIYCIWAAIVLTWPFSIPVLFVVWLFSEDCLFSDIFND